MLALVSVLALLLLGAVRVGARAMADGARGEPAGPVGVLATPAVGASPGDPIPAQPDPAGAASGVGPPGVAPTAPESPVAGATHSGDPSAATVVDLDRGATATAPDWASVLGVTDAGRQEALAAGDPEALRSWVDPDGSAWAADAALAARVHGLGARIDGGALVVLEVRPTRVLQGVAVLLVRDRRESYTVTTPAGTSTAPARPERWWQVSLRRTTGADGSVVWRIRDVVPATVPAASR